jgi:hypothetical protein
VPSGPDWKAYLLQSQPSKIYSPFGGLFEQKSDAQEGGMGMSFRLKWAARVSATREWKFSEVPSIVEEIAQNMNWWNKWRSTAKNLINLAVQRLGGSKLQILESA